MEELELEERREEERLRRALARSACLAAFLSVLFLRIAVTVVPRSSALRRSLPVAGPLFERLSLADSRVDLCRPVISFSF